MLKFLPKISLDSAMYQVVLFMAFVVPLSTAAASIAICLGIIFIICWSLKNKTCPQFDLDILEVLAVYLVCQMLIALMSLEPLISFREVLGELDRFFPLIFAMTFIKRREQLCGVLIASLLAFLINDLAGIYQYFIQGEPRAYGFTNSPTTYGPVVLMQLPILIFIAQSEIMPRLWRGISIFTACFTFIALILSMTRASWLALVAMIIIFVALNKKYRLITAKICAGLAIIFLSATFISPTLQERVSTIIDTKFQSNTERVLMWESAINIFKDYPIHGIGQEMFFKVYNEQYISPYAKERPDKNKDGHSQAHNNFLNVACEGGIIGFASFIGLYTYFFWKFFTQMTREKEFAFSAGLTAFLIISALMIEGLMNTYTNMTAIMREFWLLAGTMIAAENILKKN
ncbi:MAG: O-antigen ligase family protein [Selenomonadaceae bacterium]|nr:O-antigen ligase family protein [Selenomonadaceae bacterium]